MIQHNEERSLQDHKEINGKIDKLFELLESHEKERADKDRMQDKDITDLQQWQSATMSVVRAAMWLVSGSGVVTLVLYLIFGREAL